MYQGPLHHYPVYQAVVLQEPRTPVRVTKLIGQLILIISWQGCGKRSNAGVGQSLSAGFLKQPFSTLKALLGPMDERLFSLTDTLQFLQIPGGQSFSLAGEDFQ